jgi:hypothetical protein
MVERAGFAVDHAVRKLRRDIGDRLELGRPVEPLARPQDRLAVLDPELQAIAVELDLMHPARLGWRAVDQLAELGLEEARHRADLFRRGARLWRHRLVAAALLVAVPHRARSALPGRHERRGRLAAADGNLAQRAPRGD